MIDLRTPAGSDDMQAVRMLMTEYAGMLGVDLCFQNLDSELASLPGQYAEPGGALRIAVVDGSLAGCCALRPLDAVDHADACEMKRLFVRPSFRGMGIGRQLAVAILDAARSAGYACVLLDTLSGMEAAQAMYQDLGFTEIPPYYHNPIPGSRYLKVDL